MDFLQLAKARYSVRRYHSTPVEHDKLQYILEAGRVAPTAVNFQPQRFLVVSSKEGMDKLQKAGNMHGAPMAIVVCGLRDKSWVRPQDGHQMIDIDTSIATTQMMLEAWSLGIGSCWITWFDPEIVCEEFSLPDHVVPVNILVLGYANCHPQSPDRHATLRIPLEKMVWYEKYDNYSFPFNISTRSK